MSIIPLEFPPLYESKSPSVPFPNNASPLTCNAFVAAIPIPTSPAKVELLPEKVTGALPNVTEVPDPDQPAKEPPVPEPLKTDELSIFSH